MPLWVHFKQNLSKCKNKIGPECRKEKFNDFWGVLGTIHPPFIEPFPPPDRPHCIVDHPGYKTHCRVSQQQPSLFSSTFTLSSFPHGGLQKNRTMARLLTGGCGQSFHTGDFQSRLFNCSAGNQKAFTLSRRAGRSIARSTEKKRVSLHLGRTSGPIFLARTVLKKVIWAVPKPIAEPLGHISHRNLLC